MISPREIRRKPPAADTADSASTRQTRVSQTVIVDRPVSVVFAYRAAVSNSPEWRRGVLSVDLPFAGPIWIGTRWVETRVGPAESSEDWELELTACEPNARLGFVSRCGETEIHENDQIEPYGPNTRYTVTAEVTHGSISGPVLQKALLETLLRLKWSIEGVPSGRLLTARNRMSR